MLMKTSTVNSNNGGKKLIDNDEGEDDGDLVDDNEINIQRIMNDNEDSDDSNLNSTAKVRYKVPPYASVNVKFMSQQQQNSFRNELNYKLQKQRNELDTKLNENTLDKVKITTVNGQQNDNHNNVISSYETTSSASSSTSNNDLLNSHYNLIVQKRDKPPILKPKPRNLASIHYSDTSKLLLTNTQSIDQQDALKQQQQQHHSSSSPSTSITDLSNSNICTPQHLRDKQALIKQQSPVIINNCDEDDNEKYSTINSYHYKNSSRTNSLIRPKQRPPAPPPPIQSTVTTTFNRYITRQINESINSDVYSTLVNNPNTTTATATLKRQQTLIRNSDC